MFLDDWPQSQRRPAHELGPVAVRRGVLLLLLASCGPSDRSAPTAVVSVAVSASVVATSSSEAPPPPPALPMVAIPAGTYDVGTRGAFPTPFDGRAPRTVTSPGFEIDRTEVPRAAYEACVAQRACTAIVADAACRSGDPDLPARCVTLDQASAFCTWLGRRLPSEDEWEIAARSTEGAACVEDEASLARMVAVTKACGGTVLGFTDNVAELVTGRFCDADRPFCEGGVVRGRSRGQTVSEEPFGRFRPWTATSEGRRDKEDVGFRCAR